jgi:FtsP/CotA-like multicopper oxidase with cupredoxin domain
MEAIKDAATAIIAAPVAPAATSRLAAPVTTLAAPTSPVDQTKVPHYFGPFPNWANSPFTLPDANVTIADAPLGGTTATATATVGANGAVTGITITNPGGGYTTAPAVTITDTAGTNTSATAVAEITTSGSVTAITVDTGGAGYTAPTVTISGGGGVAPTVTVGNPLISRTYATDYATPPGTLGPVFVVVPTTMPTSGTVQSIEYFNQATAGSSPTPSAGNLFHAYVLHATGNPNEYTVAWDSGELTVPAAVDPVGDVMTIAVPNIAVTTGDTIAFYGEGIPVDVGGGADTLSYPATANADLVTPTAPVVGATIALGVDPGFPIYSQDRTYSFAATVADTSTTPPLTDATATAYGGVDAVALVTAGSGYTNPTVDFDMPDGADGVKAVAHAVWDSTTGVIQEIVVDQPGSGYSFAPNVVIRDGTIYDPILNGGSGATATATLTVQTVVLDTFGSGYTSAPTVTINDATGTGATATATVDSGAVTAITLTTPGAGYITAGGIKKFQDGLPMLCDPSIVGDCEAATNNLGQHLPLAVPDQDTFPGDATTPAADYYVIALVQHRECMSSSLPGCDPTSWPTDAAGNPVKPAGVGTLLREYVQLETPANAAWSKRVALCNETLDGTGCDPIYYPGTTDQVYAVDDPHFLGPVIAAQKDRPVRATFYNLLPTGSGGDMPIPTDSTMMGSGYGPEGWTTPVDEGTVLDDVRNPECTQEDKGLNTNCFKDSRATLHLHGGTTPWISDGTPHQWITPQEANPADNPWPEGDSVGSVPDMLTANTGAATSGVTVPDCSGIHDGCQTFYWTNQQSARLMFYHDHAFGTTRLNVYLGEAAGYLIADPTEKRLVDNGIIPAEQIPLVIQDRTFVPDSAQLAWQDPTWDATRWGGYGNFWYHHVYMPAQNPGDPSGMSAFGRWMYGPWFWPPATPPHGPIDNPYYGMDPATGFTTPLGVPCDINDPATWQYDTDPFCEPPLIPGTPNISAGMEQFNDTPLVNGTAYPTLTLEPKAYRLRILNAANDRFFNLQLYVADPSTGTESEVALEPAEVAAAQIDPNIFPTPVDGTKLGQPESTAGPNWIMIGSEGGFLPAPVEVDGQQPTTWIIDPTVFNVGNVDKHSLLLGPAERTDVIVDLSPYAGQTLIVYNDAPAAFPARVSSYDYYTDAPDLTPVGAPKILPGYGPNTRTVMQIKVAGTPAPAFDVARLKSAFRHKADGSGVFESGQHPIIVGQAEYNSAYGTAFVASGDCNTVAIPITSDPDTTSTKCDGRLRIPNQGGTWFGFNTLLSGTDSKLNVGIQPKGIHDEMNAAAFDEFGRMTANMGVEVVPATAGLQNFVLYPFINPQTELVDATNLPKLDINDVIDGVGTEVTPISVGSDGTQIWRITHNGVDTHPLHFHLYDVQLLNRVTWDNIVSPPDPTELGWKDTVRTSPLEDTIVALRPIIPALPFELPNSIRPLNPAMPLGATMGFANIDADGNPTDPIMNSLVNFGWEYVWHCHILSHEEMDMMRPQSVALPPDMPMGLTADNSVDPAVVQLAWMDNSIADTQTLVQKSGTATGPWITLETITAPLDVVPNYTGPVSSSDAAGIFEAQWNFYRVVAQNTIGYGGQFMALTAESATLPVQVPATPIAGVAPTSLAFGSLEVGTTSAAQTVTLSNSGRAPLNISSITPPAGYTQTNDCGTSLAAAVDAATPTTCTISVTFAPIAVATYPGDLVIATDDPLNPSLAVALSGTGTALLAPTNLSGTAVRTGQTETVTLTFTDNSLGETGFTLQRRVVQNAGQCTATTNFGGPNVVSESVPANPSTGLVTVTQSGIQRAPYCFRVQAVYAPDTTANSAWSNVLYLARP